jgi:hypothetical protein
MVNPLLIWRTGSTDMTLPQADLILKTLKQKEQKVYATQPSALYLKVKLLFIMFPRHYASGIIRLTSFSRR